MPARDCADDQNRTTELLPNIKTSSHLYPLAKLASFLQLMLKLNRLLMEISLEQTRTTKTGAELDGHHVSDLAYLKE
jgi:hypothetical protein